MKHKLIASVVFVMLAMISMTQPASAQCQSSVPQTLNLYQSYCIQACPWEAYVFFLHCPYDGAHNFPHLVMTPGCNAQDTECDVQCNPIEPPTWPWLPGEAPTYGQDPHQDSAIFRTNDCMDIYVYWNHHGYWVMEILMNDCAGCFCLWFDWQLPVNLLSFNSISGDGEVALNWSTASESSNSGFEVVRDGAGVVGMVASQGNGATGHSYRWVDNDVVNDVTYTYRLRAVDLSNTVEEISMTQATPTSDPQAVVTEFMLYQNYPNPFNPVTSIAFDVPQSNLVRLDVYNPVGELVTTLVNGSVSAGHHAVSFNASELSSGLYFYTIRVGNEFTSTRKMLLVK